MQTKRTRLLIVGSAIALVALLAIQVAWILKSASIKEEQFNQRVTMALCRAVEDICSDNKACTAFNECCRKPRNDHHGEFKVELGYDQKEMIDSLLHHYMDFYGVKLDYSFELAREEQAGFVTDKDKKVYRQKLEGDVAPGLVLKLHVPGKREFLLAGMSTMFITSTALIIIIMLFFWMTVRSLLKQKMLLERTTDFMNNMAHEFKTPMASISLASNMLVKSSSGDESGRQRHYAEIIRAENEKLKLQVERLLSMAALERGEMMIERKPVDMHDVIANAINCINIQVQEKQGTVTASLDAKQFTVTGDELHLTNAIINLLDNANKYSGAEPRIVIATRNENGNIVVSVSDNGIGISSEDQKSIFDKFYRVHTGDVHDVKGFGLGLAYVKKIVEQHNGSITLKSEKGKGSTFIITIPLSHEQ